MNRTNQTNIFNHFIQIFEVLLPLILRIKYVFHLITMYTDQIDIFNNLIQIFVGVFAICSADMACFHLITMYHANQTDILSH